MSTLQPVTPAVYALHKNAVVVLGALLLLVACGKRSNEASSLSGGRHSSAPVLTEHRPAVFKGIASKRLGEDCFTYGRDECLSRLCLHSASGKYVCSRACSAAADCPVSWRCSSILPGSDQAACMPPLRN